MAKVDTQQGLKASIIDRLIDPDSDGTSWRPGYSTEQMVDSVRRDMENLLNTHLTETDVPPEFVEVRNSIVTYGIPDLVSNHAAGPMVVERIRTSLEQSIARFEPRLTDVRAKIHNNAEAGALLKLEFEIHAALHVDPSPEVAFITVLKLTTGETSVQTTGN
jgi:type VI secretion system protein ImpF